MEGMDTVFLAAGHYPRYSLDLEAEVEEGVRGVRVACAAALESGVAHLVYTSSTGALSSPVDGRSVDENDVPNVRPLGSVYRAVKWEMERELERWMARGLRATTMIPGGCLGPLDVRVGTGRLLIGVVTDALPWWIDGVVPLVDVRDVAAAHVRAAVAAPLTIESRFALGGHAVRVSDLLTMIAGRYGGTLPPELSSYEDARERADASERNAAENRGRVSVPRELVDLIETGRPVRGTRAEADLGVSFRPFEKTLDDAHTWFVRNGYIRGERAWPKTPAPAVPSS
jgi:dihydroflavonol-4-reductase